VGIHFGCPTKKNGLGWSSPWEAAMTEVGAPWEATGELTREGREGEGEGERGEGA
jgi:hypothetical protein